MNSFFLINEASVSSGESFGDAYAESAMHLELLDSGSAEGKGPGLAFCLQSDTMARSQRIHYFEALEG